MKGTGLVILLFGRWIATAAMEPDSNYADLGVSSIHSDVGWTQPESASASTLDLSDGSEAATSLGLSEILIREPGFTETIGFQAPLILRGVSGDRLLVTRDGMRIADSYNAGTMLHGINAYDISSVHIDKALGSVQQGSGAIAGSIDIRTRPPGAPGLHGTLSSGFANNAEEWSIANTTTWSSSAWNVRTSLRKRDAGPFHYGNGDVAKESDYTDTDLLLDLAWTPDSRQQASYQGSIHRGGPWGKPRGFSATNYMLARTPQEDNDRHAFRYCWFGNGILQEIPIQTSWTREYRIHDLLYLDAGSLKPSYRETSEYQMQTSGVQMSPMFRLHPRIFLRTGGEAFWTTLSSPLDVIDYFEDLQFHNRVREDATSLSAAVFAESDFRLTPRTQLRTGIRQDWSRLQEGGVHDTTRAPYSSSFVSGSGLVALRSRPVQSQQVSFSLARSYRVPKPAEMFGQSVTGNGIVYGNPELRAEHGWTADLDWQTKGTLGSLQISPFFWVIDNMISKEIRAGRGITYEYRNVGRARLMGAEAGWNTPQLSWGPTNNGASLGAAYTYGSDISGRSAFSNGDRLEEMPPLRLLGSLETGSHALGPWRWHTQLDWNHYFRHWRATAKEYTTDGYDRFDLSLSLSQETWRPRPKFDVKIVNIAGSTYYPFQSFVPAKGRDIRATLSLSL